MRLPPSVNIEVDGKLINVGYTVEEYNRVIDFLDGRDWTKAPIVEANTRVTPRKLRRIGEFAATIIGGNQGYIRLDHATEDEERHAVNTLLSKSRTTGAHAQRLAHNCGIDINEAF